MQASSSSLKIHFQHLLITRGVPRLFHCWMILSGLDLVYLILQLY